MVYPISKYVWFPIIRFFVKKTVGFENLPKEGAYLLVCKHFASLDGIFIGVELIPKIKRKIHFVANIAPWGSFWQKIVAEKWNGCIPYDKNNPQQCLDVAMEHLKSGDVVGIFPEGMLQERNFERHKVKTGAARLAIWSKVPVVPIGLIHDVEVRSDLPKLYRRRQAIKNIFFNPHSLEIHIGKPFHLNEYYDKEMNKEMLVKATNKIMSKIENLTEIKILNED